VRARADCSHGAVKCGRQDFQPTFTILKLPKVLVSIQASFDTFEEIHTQAKRTSGLSRKFFFTSSNDNEIVSGAAKLLKSG
jgi:hypothetical protein